MLHFQTNDESNSWPENVQMGAAGLGMDNCSAFVNYCHDLIAVHWTTTDEMKQKTLELASKMLAKEAIPELLLVQIGGNSSYRQWYRVYHKGELYSFGLNTLIDFDYLNSIKWTQQ